jgi:uncharacterized damage-inducible protein DinB
MDPEATALLERLEGQRQHVRGILEGLSADDLHRPVLPTGWSCVGLVQHLALDVERFWFREVIGGETLSDAEREGDPANAWQVPPTTSPDVVLDRYRTEIAKANDVIRLASMDANPAWWPEGRFGDWHPGDVRRILLHVIVETACHAGHLDAARELIDGGTWLIQD